MMTTMGRQGAAAQLRQYAQVGLRTAVESASPHRLILMLMDGALARIAAAGGHMQRGDVASKGQSISMAIAIVDGLRASLNHSEGGDLAGNLDGLYVYMSERLLRANLENDADALSEVRNLLGEIRAAWAGIEPRMPAGATPRAIR